MTPTATEDHVLRRYLLGRLAPDSLDDVEQRLFSDDLVFWEHLSLAEDELIDLYVRGDLDSEERADVERHFLCTRERRAKLEFARALHAHVAERRALRGRPWDWLRGHVTAPGWALATAAALLLMLPALAWQFASAPRAVREVEATLAPGLVRDVAGEVIRVRLTRDCRLVHLDLEPGSAAYPSYRATLHEVAGDELWSQNKLVARTSAGREVITLTVPCAMLPEADYYVRLYGVAPGSEPVPLHRYDFRVLLE